MLNFTEQYTTNEKIIAEEADKTIEIKAEAKKTVLSNDAYALGSVLNELQISILNQMRTLIK